MSLTSYRAAPPRGILRFLARVAARIVVFEGMAFGGCATPGFVPRACLRSGFGVCDRREGWLLVRFGGDLLSHVLRRSTIGVLALNGRVRDGIGCFTSTMTTKPKKKPGRCTLFSGWLPMFWADKHQFVPSYVVYSF
jgi:hypothetical protein